MTIFDAITTDRQLGHRWNFDFADDRRFEQHVCMDAPELVPAGSMRNYFDFTAATYTHRAEQA